MEAAAAGEDDYASGAEADDRYSGAVFQPGDPDYEESDDEDYDPHEVPADDSSSEDEQPADVPPPAKRQRTQRSNLADWQKPPLPMNMPPFEKEGLGVKLPDGQSAENFQTPLAVFELFWKPIRALLRRASNAYFTAMGNGNVEDIPKAVQDPIGKKGLQDDDMDDFLCMV